MKHICSYLTEKVIVVSYNLNCVVYRIEVKLYNMVELCRYLLIVAASVSLIGDVMSVTDEEFQVT